jgi:predicted sulfurtransferase
MRARNCGIQMVHDRDGYICGRSGSEICSDCGTALCADHAEACEFCPNVYCDSCLYFHSKESHMRKQVGQVVPEYRRTA